MASGRLGSAHLPIVVFRKAKNKGVSVCFVAGSSKGPPPSFHSPPHHHVLGDALVEIFSNQPGFSAPHHHVLDDARPPAKKICEPFEIFSSQPGSNATDQDLHGQKNREEQKVVGSVALPRVGSYNLGPGIKSCVVAISFKQLKHQL